MVILTWGCVHGAGGGNVIETRNPLSKRKSVGWELFISPELRTTHPVANLLKTSTGRVAQIFGAQKSKREHRAARAACPRTTRYIQQHRPDLRGQRARCSQSIKIRRHHRHKTHEHNRASTCRNECSNEYQQVVTCVSDCAKCSRGKCLYLELPRRSPPAQRPRAR